MSVSLKNITKYFDDQLVVANVSLEVATGELFVLLGASGSGKSTVLKLIAGLTFADHGQIIINERDVTSLAPQKRGIGFVFQNYSIFRHMTVYENIEFGLKIRGVNFSQRRIKSEELLDLVDLGGMGDRYPSQLSGGQQQRVALARALAYEPNVLLLDEPFGALDVKIRSQLREQLRLVQRELKITTLLVTHDQQEAFELADRIGLIDHNHLIEIGTPEGLYHHPRKERVASFIGGANILIGRSEGASVKLGGISLPYPSGSSPVPEGERARIMFRPESVVATSAPPASTMLSLGRGQVIETVFSGIGTRVKYQAIDLYGARSPRQIKYKSGREIIIEGFCFGGDKRLGDVPQVGETQWLGLPSFHILDPVPFKVLVHVDNLQATATVAEYGSALINYAYGSGTLMHIPPVSAAGKLEELESIRLPLMKSSQLVVASKIRSGSSTRQIVQEAQEGEYDIVVLNRTPESQSAKIRTTKTVQLLLEEGQIPVLLVDQPRPVIDKILICTGAGEPGKHDIRFAGRLARQVGATATIIHALRPGSTAFEQRRVARHLEVGQHILEGLGVASDICTEVQDPVELVTEFAKKGNYDLIVLGAPLARGLTSRRMPDITTRIVNGTDLPVLVVPMAAG